MILEDKDIRDILQGGEEQVSTLVWEGVARGLDKAAAASRRRVVVLWSSVVSLAAAAAVAALVVFLPGRGKVAVPGGDGQVPQVVAENVPEFPSAGEVSTETVSGEEDGVAGQISRSAFAASAFAYNYSSDKAVDSAPAEPVLPVADGEPEEESVAEVTVPAPGTENVLTEPEIDITEPETAAEWPAVPVSADEPEAGKTVEEEPSRVNPFALLMAEENRIGNKPVAVTLGGLAQAGKAPAPARSGPGMAAPAVPQTGIRESGDNTFELPVSFGVGLRFPLVSRLSIGAGVSYTRLARSFTGTYTEAEDGVLVRRVTGAKISETQQYVGIPVNVYYDAVSGNNFTASVYVGASVERCVDIDYRIPDSGGTIHYSGEPKGLQPSVGAGVALQYDVLPQIGLYAEPGVHYYFDAHQAPSLRTMQPWMVSLELGVRYNLGR